MSRLAPRRCARCNLPLHRVTDGRPFGLHLTDPPMWLCLPCAYLLVPDDECRDVPASFRPEWNR
jgi:hypothetical protein